MGKRNVFQSHTHHTAERLYDFSHEFFTLIIHTRISFKEKHLNTKHTHHGRAVLKVIYSKTVHSVGMYVRSRKARKPQRLYKEIVYEINDRKSTLHMERVFLCYIIQYNTNTVYTV